jgi:NTE family protein
MPSRTASHPVGRNERCGRIALVLQGGGALGAYQAGVYQALQEAGLEPDWVSGVSIGAINGAIIAGNPPALRVQRLRTFWERITERKIWNYTPDGDVFRRTRNAASSWLTILHSQPGFFTPTQKSYEGHAKDYEFSGTSMREHWTSRTKTRR